MRIATSCRPAVVGMIAAITLLVVAPTLLDAQDLTGRSRIELKLGVGVPGTSTSARVGNVVTETEGVGALGAIAFSHWIRERTALTISAGAMATDVESSVSVGQVTSRTATIVPLLGGLRFYVTEATPASNLRPFVSLTAGPVFGTESESRVGGVIVNRSVTRTAFGVRAGAGLDVPFADRWMFGLFGGFCGMTDFADPIGGESNYSSPDFGVSISLLFGG